MKKFKDSLTEEELVAAREVLGNRTEEERIGLRNFYKQIEKKKSVRRSVIIFAFAIIFCIIPAVLPFDAMGLLAPAPMVIATLCLFLSFAIVVIAIVSFVRSMDAVNSMPDDEKELRGAYLFAKIITEQMAEMSETLANTAISESAAEYIARRNGESKARDIPPLDEADCEECEADDIPELDDGECEVVENTEPCDKDECED